MINCIPKLDGQFELEWGGQFTPKLVVNLHWNRVVNLTGFSTLPTYHKYFKELQCFGYIEYTPSYHPGARSEIKLNEKEVIS